MKNIILLILTILSGATKAQIKSPNSNNKNKITILTAGYPRHDLYQRKKIANDYHFKIVTIGGCTIGKKKAKRAERHNEISEKKLEQINGKGWHEKFENDVKEAYTRDSILIVCVRKDSTLSNSNILFYWVDSISKDRIAKLCAFGFSNNSFACTYRIFVDIEKLLLIKVEDAPS